MKKEAISAVGVLATVTEFLSEQAAFVAADDSSELTWETAVAVIRHNPKLNETVLYLTDDALDTCFSDDEWLFLSENELVAIGGEANGKFRTTLNGVRGYTTGILYDTLKKRAREASKEQGQVAILRNRVRDLERELRIAHETGSADDAMAALTETIDSLVKSKPAVEKISTKILMPNTAGEILGGVPTFMLSDLHWAERVDPAQIQWMNEYSIEVAHRRFDRVVSKSMELLFTHMGGMRYEGMVLALGGDIVSGNIHEELQRTNELKIAESVLDVADYLSKAIISMASQFPFIYVPCVVGNHGRMERKPTAKGKAHDSFDWLVYEIAKRQTQHIPNVVWEVSTSTDLPYNVYGTRYLLTHGDQVKSSGGVGGIYPSLLKTDTRKRKRSMITGQGGYDYLVMGHWHKYAHVDGVILNGSLKGYDEWVYDMNFEWEPPQQALWITHPDYGITHHMPVLAEENTLVAKSSVPLSRMVHDDGSRSVTPTPLILR